jgi:predicted dehydrogenase
MNPDLPRRTFLRNTGAAAFAAASFPSILAAEAEGAVTLALVGCAHIHTPSFVDLLKRRKDVRVKSVWDHQAGRAENSANKLGAKVVADAGEIWADGEVQGVVICSETNRHRDLILAAAKAGKHMFAEKPLGINAQESREMALAIENAGLLFTTGYFMRTDRKHLFLKAEVARGAFGKITRARGSNCHSGSLNGWFDTEWRWMADPKIAGVGAFGDLGTHKLDILMWLFGAVESVTGDIRVITKRYGDCDETGEGLLRFRNGTIATLAAGWVDVADPVQLLISGTEAHAVIVNDRLYYKNKGIEGADGVEPFTDLPSAPPLPLYQFVNAVAGDRTQPLVSPREAADRVSVMEAMYTAARDRSWCKPA